MISSLTTNALLSTLMIAVAVVTTHPINAETNLKVKALVQTNYDRINAAFVRKDIKEATALFTPDYVSINPEGQTQTLTEFRNYYDNLFSKFNIKLTSNQTVVKHISVNSDGLDVAIEQSTRGTIAGFNKIAIEQTSRNLWVKTPQGWRLKQSKILTNRTTFNGQTFKG